MLVYIREVAAIPLNTPSRNLCITPPAKLTYLILIIYLKSFIDPVSESELLYDWRFTANHFVLAPSPLKITITVFFFSTELLRS
jgi:hypothetical protein